MGSLVSSVVANMFMEHLLEEKLHATAPKELKPKLWKSYGDDILEMVRKGSVEDLLFRSVLDLLLVRTDTSRVKLQTYRKPTHTDQYLNFNSRHPIEHKLSVVRTLLERTKSLVTDSEDKEKEDTHVEKVLQTC